MNQRGDDQCGHAGGGRKNADKYCHYEAAALLSCVPSPLVTFNDDEGLDAFAKLEFDAERSIRAFVDHSGSYPHELK